MPDPTAVSKLEALRELLREMGSLAIAYSGGVDSAFLLAVAHQEARGRALAMTVSSPLSTTRELIDARETAKLIGAQQIEVPFDPLAVPDFSVNSPERCYICKKHIFFELWECARRHHLDNLLDGTNKDDLSDYRPGIRAARELRVRSPLQEAGLTKQEIRILSRRLGLPTWNRPAAACLASRIPYGEEITPEKLRTVEQAEAFLHDLGFILVRVRLHRSLARIEVNPDDFPKLLRYREEIIAALQNSGCRYVTLDLAGYRMRDK